MKLRELMTKSPIRLHPDENAAVAARAFQRYNIGAVPVCGSDGRICGILTDRDLVTRCLAAGKDPRYTKIRDMMTTQLVTAPPDMDASDAAALMGRAQVRRLPVLENGRLCGIVSLGDLAVSRETGSEAADALTQISSNMTARG
jgi:CBS domain-containing protein